MSVFHMLLLFALLAARQRNRELLDALLPHPRASNGRRSVHTPAHGAADTPADLLLSMLGELLEGRMPDLRDILFIRTYLLSNQDVYRPLNLRGHIKGANLDADVAQSLMNQLGDVSSGGQTTSPARAVVRQAVKTLRSLTAHSDSGVNSATQPQRTSSSRIASSARNQQLSPLHHCVSSQPAQPACETLTGALAFILTPLPANWMDAGCNNSGECFAGGGAISEGGTMGTREAKSAAMPHIVAAAHVPMPVSGLLEKAANLILHGREKSRRRASACPDWLPAHQADTSSNGTLPAVRAASTASASVTRRSLAGAVLAAGAGAGAGEAIAEPQQGGASDLRTTLRRSCGGPLPSAVPVQLQLQLQLQSQVHPDDSQAPRDESPVTTDVTADAESAGAVPATLEVAAPRRLSVLWDVFGRKNTGSLSSPPKGSLDGQPSGGASGTPVAASFSMLRPPSMAQLSASNNMVGGPGVDSALALQYTHSRLGMAPSRAHSVRNPVVLPAEQQGSINGAVTAPAGAAVIAPASAFQKRSLAPPVSVIEEVERLLARADSWQFDTFALQEATQGHALSALGFYLMQREGLLDCFRIKPVVMARLLRAIEAGYLDNPYHNATHAADVLQTLHVIVHATQLNVHYLDPLGLLAAYYAAIVHDYAHPGLTSDFLIATSDPLAVRYNDKSPLENHHCAASFALLQRPDFDALASLSQAERSAFRKQVIELVLATDMKQHFSILSHFNTVHRLSAYSQQQLQQQQPGGGPASPASRPPKRPIRRTLSRALSTIGDNAGEGLSGSVPVAQSAEPVPKPSDDTERLLSLQVVLKCADIGHLGETLEVHKKWLGVLEEEFFRQGDRERDLGLPISPLFDRAKQGVSKSQVGFYDFVALPLVHALSTAFPGAQPLMRCFMANYNHWRVADGQSPVELLTGTKPVAKGGNRPSGQFVGLGSLLLSVPDDVLDVPEADSKV